MPLGKLSFGYGFGMGEPLTLALGNWSSVSLTPSAFDTLKSV